MSLSRFPIPAAYAIQHDPQEQLASMVYRVNQEVDLVFALMSNEERITAEEKVLIELTKIDADPTKAKLVIPGMSDESAQRLIQARHLFYGNTGNADIQQDKFSKYGNFESKQQLFIRPETAKRIYVAVRDLILFAFPEAKTVSIPREPKKFLYEVNVIDLLDTFTVYYHAMLFARNRLSDGWEETFCDVIDRGLGKVFLTYVESVHGQQADFVTRVAEIKAKAEKYISYKQNRRATPTHSPELLSAQAEYKDVKERLEEQIGIHREFELDTAHTRAAAVASVEGLNNFQQNAPRRMPRDEIEAAVVIIERQRLWKYYKMANRGLIRAEAELKELRAEYIAISNKYVKIELALVFN